MTVDIIDIFSIVGSVFSIVLGSVAIWLAVVFYKMSDKASREIERESNSISASVQKLELLFDKLYSGTFNMMQETVTDMRKHFYSINGNKDTREELQKEIEQKLNTAIQAAADEIKNTQMTDKEIKDLLQNIVSESKEVESDIQKKSIKNLIINYLKGEENTTFPTLSDMLTSKDLIKGLEGHKLLFAALEELVNEQIIEDPFAYRDGEKVIYHNKEITLK